LLNPNATSGIAENKCNTKKNHVINTKRFWRNLRGNFKKNHVSNTKNHANSIFLFFYVHLACGEI
jgi:hypothetical protein